MEVSELISIEFFMHCIPGFASALLETLYGNVFTSLEHLGIKGCLAETVSTYVAWKGTQPLAVLLFRQEGHTVRVLNEAVHLPEEEVRRFAEQVFARLPSATVIRFHAIRTEPLRLGLPYQKYNYSEDIIIPLPDSADAYTTSLGKATRKNIKHHLSRLRRAHPSFDYRMVAGSEVDEDRIRDIIRFNRMRFGHARAEDDEETQRLIELVRVRGVVGIATIDGRVCGGAICTRVGANYFSHITAHDPRYDDYRLGTICCFLAICACIGRGGKEFHLLWGKYDYKYRLGGIEHDLEDLLIYRSWVQYLRCADIAMTAACNGYVRRGKVWLRRVAPRDPRVVQCLKLVNGLLRGRKVVP